jgi:hypothetical protein
MAVNTCSPRDAAQLRSARPDGNPSHRWSAKNSIASSEYGHGSYGFADPVRLRRAWCKNSSGDFGARHLLDHRDRDIWNLAPLPPTDFDRPMKCFSILISAHAFRWRLEVKFKYQRRFAMTRPRHPYCSLRDFFLQVGLASLLNSVKGTIAGVNPAIDVQFKVLRTQIRESLMQDELMATLCGFFGVLAVTLAAIGLYGVIAYTVAKRTNEIGIRMALGAQRSCVIGLILREVAVLIAIGVVVGVGLTLAGSKASGSLLFGLKRHDPLTLVLAIVILVTIGFAASFIPARRATRVDPVVALRDE